MKKKLYLFANLLLLAVLAEAQPTDNVNFVAEQMPYFMGCLDLENGTAEKRNCSNKNLIGFISRNIQYPQAATERGIEGTVFLRFLVNSSGKIMEPVILRDIGGDCGKEALRILALMPDWEPAYNNGEAVAVSLDLPVTFSLQNANALFANKYQIQWGTLRNKEITKEDLENHVPKKLVVRDEMGDEVDISTLTFIFQKKRSYHEATSTGRINKKMEKLLKKVKKGGTFTIVAAIQKKGEIYEIEREYKVVE